MLQVSGDAPFKMKLVQMTNLKISTQGNHVKKNGFQRKKHRSS